MKNIYCTLFNHKYLSRGLALFESLQEIDKKIELYVVAMDDETFSKLTAEQINNLKVISIAEIERKNPDMLVAKANRSAYEYCWTCTSCVIYYILNHYDCDICTYLDADIYFYQNPNFVLDKLKGYSTILIPHQYSNKEKFRLQNLSGKFCVEFLPFKKEKQSMELLNYWKNQCLEWCYDRFEDGKFGDQKYLEEWENRDDVYVSVDHGLGVAPWNAERYELIKNEEGLYELIDLENNRQKYLLTFYHYSRLKFFDKDVICLDNCHRIIPEQIRKELYIKYLKKIEAINIKYHLNEDAVDYHATEHFRDDPDNLIQEYNYYRKSTFLAEEKHDI